MKNSPKTHELTIAIFDSGVGGFSILESVQKRWPTLKYIYCSDNAHYPYGLKSESDVVTFANQAASKIAAKFKPHIFIVACNTASTIALPSVRKTLDIPVVGVVPAIKPAALSSKTKIIGLLATPATVKRPYTDQLIADFASHCKVLCIGSSKLVDLAEEKTRGQRPDPNIISKEIAPFFSDDVNTSSEKRLDTIVLGCTHFSLLKEELLLASKWPINYFDASQAIVERVTTLLSEHQLLQLIPPSKEPLREDSKNLTVVFTAQQDSIYLLESYLVNFGFKKPFVFI